jgi:hypothetical protein
MIATAKLKNDQGDDVMNAELPKIFTLIACPMIGELGPDSQIVERESCETCEQAYPEEVNFLDYQFDVWEQAELIKAGNNVYAITRRLYDALQAAGLKGFSARPMKVSRSPIFDDMDPEHKIAIPEFLQLLIVGKADGPSGWWERDGVCATCNRIIWKTTDRVTSALFAKYSNKAGPPRQVSAASWHGDDAFFLTDPGPPVMTERFKSFAEAQNVQELVLDPAQWV